MSCYRKKKGLCCDGIWGEGCKDVGSCSCNFSGIEEGKEGLSPFLSVSSWYRSNLEMVSADSQGKKVKLSNLLAVAGGVGFLLIILDSILFFY